LNASHSRFSDLGFVAMLSNRNVDRDLQEGKRTDVNLLVEEFRDNQCTHPGGKSERKASKNRPAPLSESAIIQELPDNRSMLQLPMNGCLLPGTPGTQQRTPGTPSPGGTPSRKGSKDKSVSFAEPATKKGGYFKSVPASCDVDAYMPNMLPRLGKSNSSPVLAPATRTGISPINIFQDGERMFLPSPSLLARRRRSTPHLPGLFVDTPKVDRMELMEPKDPKIYPTRGSSPGAKSCWTMEDVASEHNKRVRRRSMPELDFSGLK